MSGSTRFLAMAMMMIGDVGSSRAPSKSRASGEKAGAGKPLIKKLGTIDCDMVETTPIVFHGHLYRFEVCVHPPAGLSVRQC